MAGVVGLIGIGLMGTALARRLLDAGYRVVGFDIAPARRDALRAMGGEPVESVAEVAARCQRYLIAVMTVAQVEQVVEGKDGLIEAGDAKLSRVAMCTATCEPDRIEALAARAAARGFTFLDTPVSGTSRQVSAGRRLRSDRRRPGRRRGRRRYLGRDLSAPPVYRAGRHRDQDQARDQSHPRA